MKKRDMENLYELVKKINCTEDLDEAYDMVDILNDNYGTEFYYIRRRVRCYARERDSYCVWETKLNGHDVENELYRKIYSK